MTSYTPKLIRVFAGGLLAMFIFPAITHGAAVLYNVQFNGLSSTYSGAAQTGSSGDVWNKPALSNYEGDGTSHTSATTIVSSAALVDSTGAASLATLSVTGVNYEASYATTSTGSPLSGLNNQALKCDYISSTPVPTFTFSFSGLPDNAAVGLYVYGANYNANTTGSTWTMAAANGGAVGTCGYGGAYSTTNSTGLNVTLAGSRKLGWDLVQGTTDGSGNLSVVATPVSSSYASAIWWQTYINGLQLQVYSKPAITGLNNQTAIQGANAVLSPAVTGVPEPAYQWRENDVNMTGETNATLTLVNVQYSQNSYVYSLIASNPAGAVTNSMTLTVIVLPSITGLNNQAVQTGNTATIAPTVAGVPTPTLQWQFNGTNLTNGLDANGSIISGSTTSSLGIANAQAADSGTYSLVASNSAGIVTNGMTLTVSSGNVAPGITGPTDQTVVQSNNATFRVSVTGLPVPALQWLVNGAVISGATGSTLTVTNVQYSQNGFTYSLVAGNSAGMATNSAQMFVLTPPVISAQPADLAVVVSNSARFSVTATGVPAVSYQWNRNGSPIANATSASYTLNNALGANNGAVFSVTVSNSVSVLTSSNATLTVLSTMTGTFLPTNGAVNISPDQQLRIVFTGSSPLLNTNGTFTVRDAADNSVVQTIDASQFLSYTPGNTSIQTIPNAAIRTEQGSYSGTGTGSTTYYYMPIALYGNEAWITLTNRLLYGHTYYATCDTGLFLDSTGDSFPGITGTNTWVFSTKASGPATPTASTGPTTITIGLDGTGDFATFQGAFDWIPQSNTLARTVHVLPGIYRDSATLAGNRNLVTIVGDGASRTNAQLIYPFAYFAPPNPVFTAGSLRIESSDVAVENITLDNIIYNVYHPTGYPSSGASTNFGGAINTLATSGNRIVFDSVLIKGGQDTIYNILGSIYYNNCEVWGSVDFIYGAALSVFDQCNIVQIRNVGGPCTAPDTAYAQPYGINFLNCTFPQAFVTNGYPYDVGAATTTFMRPWGKDGMTASINCAIGNQFNTEGYQTFGNTNEDECRAREYGTTLIGGGSLNISQIRWNAGAYWCNTIDPDYTNNPSLLPTDPLLAPPTGTNNRVVVTVNPANYTLSAIFGNSYFNLNGWLPAIIPIITSQPTNLTINVGSTATFTVAATGLPGPSFQWLKNGTNYSNATNATLSIANVQAGDAATYSVIVSNNAGSVTSSNAVLVMSNIAPNLTGPANQTVVQGSNATFTASVAGLPQPDLQWFVNGTNIPGATGSSWTVTNVQYSQNGSVYSLVAGNSAGIVTNSANLYVLVLPAISIQPTNLVVSNTLTATFAVTATGVPAVEYQWYFNGGAISGATASNYIIAAVSPANSGNYYVTVTNSVGSVTSTEVLLTVATASLKVPLPAINTNNNIIVTNIMYGAVGDGVFTNTTAIQSAINEVAKGGMTNGLYGGTVEIPGAGIYLCGPLYFTNNVNLQIDAGAILRMLPFGQYPMTWYTNGTDVYFVAADNFIQGNNLTNIEISGSGAIDGQGSPWWPWAYTNSAVRPIMISWVGCNRELIQDVTLSNSPEFHIGVSFGGNTTVQYVTEVAPSSSDPADPSHNTDACDISGTNTLVQFNNVSVGDDDFACSGGTADVIISNNVYGTGHGTSIGSYTSPYVTNLTVVNCTYTNTLTGAHIKSDRGRGGFVDNINYYNLVITNAQHPIQIYCQYTNTTIPSLDSITPSVAAAYPAAPVTSTTPMYRDITISNFNGYAQSGRAAGLIWGLPECSISNVTLINVNLTGSYTFGIYDAKNVQIINSTNNVPAGVSQYSFFDADVTFSNSTPSANVVTLDGAATNGIANRFTFYNSLMTMKDTNAIDLNSSVTLGSSTFTISNNLTMTASNSFNYVLGDKAATVIVNGNLVLGGTNNIYAGNGFTSGIYTLMTYSGALSGALPVLAVVPTGYNCTLDTNTPGQVRLTAVSISLVPPPAPTNLVALTTNGLVTLSWSPAATATAYNVKRSLTSGSGYTTNATVTATNYTDTQVTGGATYYYVISAINSAGGSTNSAEVSVTPQTTVFVTGTANIFQDGFSTSTVNSATPSASTAASSSYEILSSKSWNPLPSLAAGHLQFGIGSTSSGSVEVQTLFAATPVTLATIGDSLSLVVTFTNTAGLLTASSTLGFGLYDSGRNYPVPGGLNSTATTGSSANAVGNAQTWTGYVGQLAFTGADSQILTRPAQITGTLSNNDQDVVTSGSGSSSYNNPSGSSVGAASSTPSVTLIAGNPYTEVLTITLSATNVLAITNALYAGTDTNAPLLSEFGGVASGASYLTNSFDALAVGWRETASQTTAIDINQISVNATLIQPETLVSLVPANLTYQVSGGQLQLSWPADHLGWRLQIQTNSLATGIGTNWFDVAGSPATNNVFIPIDPDNGSVFLRLIYP